MGFTIDFSVLNQKGTPALYSDIFANRPAAGYQGRLFIATDTAAIYEDTGTAWTLIANVSSGAGTLQQVTTNGNTSNVGISVTAGGVSTNSATITGLTTGSVPFAGAGGLISQDNANLFWDDTNNRLGINTNTPGNSLDVHTDGTNPTIALNNTAGNQSALSFLNTSVAKWRIGNTATNTLDIYNFTLAAIALQIKANNNAVFISSVQADDFFIQPSGYSTLAALSRNLAGAGYGVLSLRNSAVGNIQPSTLSVDRTYTLPDATGTIALTSNLSAYLPLTGGSLSGNLTVNNGITFPATQVPSADPNTLDDYEEGTFTPNVGGTATYATQSGIYTKIGNKVYFKLIMSITAIGTGDLQNIFGLPFTSDSSSTGYPIYFGAFQGLSTTVSFIAGRIGSSGTSIGIRSTFVPSIGVNAANVFTSGTTVEIAGFYGV